MRLRNNLLSIAIFSLAGCGTRSLPFDDSDGGAGGGPDLAQPVRVADLAIPITPVVDLAVPVVDLALGGSLTGDPCTRSSDCGGIKPFCLIKDSQGMLWPGGYCTSYCNPQKNDPATGINATCPGVGTCLGQGTSGSCELACTAMDGMMPCTRQGYSCFQGCEPTSYSQCDPRKPGGCGNGRTCVRFGLDPVGGCYDACDPFAQGCAADKAGPRCCYGSYDTGEGFCIQATQNGGNGDACRYLTDCGCGFSCSYGANGKGTCRAWCGGPNKLPCKNGAACFDYAPGTVPSTVLGVCGG
jgi:hypothetical protein